MNMSKKSSHKILLCFFIIPIALLLLIYIGFTFYFTNHFFYDTKINGLDVSKMKVNQVEQLLEQELNTYILELHGRDNVTDYIYGKDISIGFLSDGSVTAFLNEQNSFLWFLSFFQKKEHTLENCISYDDSKLEEVMQSLLFFEKQYIQAPKNAHIKYEKDKGYCLIEEELGSTVNKKVFKNALSHAILTGATTLSLDEQECYKNPKVYSTDENLLSLYEKLSLYTSAKITYNFGTVTEVVDHSVIKKWLKINKKKHTVKIQKDNVRAFVDYIGSTYNTFGKTRHFISSNGNRVSVSGGDYGWLLNREKEATALIKAVKKGKTVNRKPSYIQKAASYEDADWGNTYVEINLTAQHLWYYKDGRLIVESDFVSGNERRGWSTPQGVYDLTYKERDAILGANSNADYRTPVSYWMPFNGNIGMHDSNWRSKFGGEIYKTNGSHGCINLPVEKAKVIYENISAGVPVVCYLDPNYQRKTQETEKTEQEKDSNKTEEANETIE